MLRGVGKNMNLTENDLKDITVALVLIYMGGSTPMQYVDTNTSEHREFQKRCGDLHDRIQVVRRKNGTFVSVG